MPSDASSPAPPATSWELKVLSDGNNPAAPAAAVPLDARMEDLVPYLPEEEGGGRPG